MVPVSSASGAKGGDPAVGSFGDGAPFVRTLTRSIPPQLNSRNVSPAQNWLHSLEFVGICGS